ncbi:MAG: hypothetical protein AAFO29_08425, partial [Actinomycetota bacterium]
QSERSSTRILAVVVAFVMIGMVGLALRSTSSAAAPETGSAALTVGGVTYEFVPSACTITSTDFLAAGSGQIDGQDFWVSMSPEAAEIALGTSDESARSDDAGDLWLRNDGAVEWTVEGDSIEAELSLRDERVSEDRTNRARFSASCAS